MAYSDRDKTLSVRVSQELLDALDDKAIARNCNRTDYILTVLGNDVGVKVELPKVFNEDRIIALENKIAEVESKILSYDAMSAIVKEVIWTMKQFGQL
ncbi:hypothetical protein NIES4071_110110 (plasmid) [Calothrix sp. NIES-4071]|nr:hypothetical protein NIES4071_110110 [Calothrix sp. NIES-4071]